MTKTPLELAVRAQLEQYFADLGDASPNGLLAMVTHCVERTVVQVALERTAGNQTRAAEMLGITRGTLRKKIQTHDLAV